MARRGRSGNGAATAIWAVVLIVASVASLQSRWQTRAWSCLVSNPVSSSLRPSPHAATRRLHSMGRAGRPFNKGGGGAMTDQQKQALAEMSSGKKVDLPINEQITSQEVRLSFEASADSKEMVEVNEVLLTKDALERAKSKGLDLILVNQDADPPVVKIANVGKYLYEQAKKDKEVANKGKALKVKEVKMSYVIGDHDLMTHVRKVEKWLENKRQQVSFKVVMKGRTKVFEKQARSLLERVRREIASFGRAAGAPNHIQKDKRGDLTMLVLAGVDPKLLKEMKEEAEAEGLLDVEEEGDEEDGDDEDDEEDAESGKADAAPIDASLAKEIADLEAEIEEVRQELLDCGIKPGQIGQQEEMRDLNSRLSQLKAKA